MTQLKDIRITLPKPMHAIPHQSGVFEHFPQTDELKKAFAAFSKAASEEERMHCQSGVAGYLKRMAGAYHASLPELLSICRAHASLMSDANLDRAASLCEVAFHGHCADSDKPDVELLLKTAAHALAFIEILLRHKLMHQEDAFAELHQRFFHFSRCALACQQQLGGAVRSALISQVSTAMTAYLLLGRLDLFSMGAEEQAGLLHALSPVFPLCAVHFIPADEAVDPVDGFWIEREDKRLAGRSVLHNSLAAKSSSDRIVASIAPLIRMLEEAGNKAGGTIQTQSAVPSAMHQLLRRKLRMIKRSDKRLAVRESVQLLCHWDDVVDMPDGEGVFATLLDVDASGFRLIVDEHYAELPAVGSIVALNRPGSGVRRAMLVWRREHERRMLLGGSWLRGEFDQAQLSMLGHSEMSEGLRQWHALLRRVDDKHVACWLGERELQPGISILLPVGGKKFSATLDRVEHRGGNFCQGVLLIREAWKEVNFELDI